MRDEWKDVWNEIRINEWECECDRRGKDVRRKAEDEAGRTEGRRDGNVDYSSGRKRQRMSDRRVCCRTYHPLEVFNDDRSYPR